MPRLDGKKCGTEEVSVGGVECLFFSLSVVWQEEEEDLAAAEPSYFIRNEPDAGTMTLLNAVFARP